MTVDQAAKELGVSPRRVRALIEPTNRKLIEAGRLPIEKFGRDWNITEGQLDFMRDRKPGNPNTKRPSRPSH